MSNPFPAAEAQQLRRLTKAGIDLYRDLNDRDQEELKRLRESRAAHVAEIDSIDEVMADLHATIGRRQAKMRGDVISLLPVGAVPPLPSHPGDPREQQTTWNGFSPPESDSFAAEPDLSPDPDKNLQNFGEAHDAQDAREGVTR